MSWTRIPDQAGLREAIELGPVLIAKAPDEDPCAFTAPWGDFLDGAAEPFVVSERPSQVAVALLLAAEASPPGVPRQACWPLEIAQCVRMLGAHLDLRQPASRHPLTLGLEKVPLVIYAAQSLADILRRHPQHVILAAPSVSFRDLSTIRTATVASFSQGLAHAGTATEVRRFLPPFEGVGRSVLHDLGNRLGPLLALRSVGVPRPPTPTGERHGSTLLRILMAGGETDESVNDEATGPFMNGTRVLLIDDDAHRWAPLFHALGAEPSSVDLKTLPPNDWTDLLSPQSIVLCDLRLDESSSSPKGIEYLKQLLRVRNTIEGADALMIAAFTSSSDQRFRHELEEAGIDAYLLKPRTPADVSASMKELLDTLRFVTTPTWRATSGAIGFVLPRLKLDGLIRSRSRAIATRSEFRLTEGTACLLREENKALKEASPNTSHFAAKNILHRIVHRRLLENGQSAIEALALLAAALPSKQVAVKDHTHYHRIRQLKVLRPGEAPRGDPLPGDRLMAEVGAISALWSAHGHKNEVRALQPGIAAYLNAASAALQELKRNGYRCDAAEPDLAAAITSLTAPPKQPQARRLPLNQSGGRRRP